MAVGEIMFKKGLTGYMSIEYLTFLDKRRHNRQRIWALNLFPYLTSCAMSFVLFNFLSGGRYNPKSGRYHLASEFKEDEEQQLIGQFNGSERGFAVFEYIYHPNLASMQYSAFFNACRLNGVCFDVEVRYLV